MEKRRHSRVTVRGLSADITDGIGCFTGTITDVSRSGFRIVDLPEKITAAASSYTVVISGPDLSYKMTVMPRWWANDIYSKSVGIHIENPPLGWTNSIIRLEPKAEDVWSSVKEF